MPRRGTASAILILGAAAALLHYGPRIWESISGAAAGDGAPPIVTGGGPGAATPAGEEGGTNSGILDSIFGTGGAGRESYLLQHGDPPTDPAERARYGLPPLSYQNPYPAQAPPTPSAAQQPQRLPAVVRAPTAAAAAGQFGVNAQTFLQAYTPTSPVRRAGGQAPAFYRSDTTAAVIQRAEANYDHSSGLFASRQYGTGARTVATPSGSGRSYTGVARSAGPNRPYTPARPTGSSSSRGGRAGSVFTSRPQAANPGGTAAAAARSSTTARSGRSAAQSYTARRAAATRAATQTPAARRILAAYNRDRGGRR